LIIAAPEPMFKEVHELVMALDQAGTQTQEAIEVRTLHLANPDVVNTALRAILGENVSTSGSSGGSASSRSSSSPAPSAANIDAIRQRMEMFNRMRSSGGFGDSSSGGRATGSTGSGARPSGAPGSGGRPGGSGGSR
nr:general secretion pathway protein [Pirellulaceae bacterium]